MASTQAKGALRREAQIEKNRQEYVVEKVNLDIMAQAQTFKARARKKKGNKGQVNFVNLEDVIIAGTDEGVKRRRNKRKKQKGKVKRKPTVKRTPIVGVDTIGESTVKTNFNFNRQVMANVPTDESSDEASESESSVVCVTLEELEDGEIVDDVQEEEVQPMPVAPMESQDDCPPTPGTIRLSLVGSHDLTSAMAGSQSCSTNSGKSSNDSNNDSRDTKKFDRLARDIGDAINNLDNKKTDKTRTKVSQPTNVTNSDTTISGTPITIFTSRTTNPTSQAHIPGQERINRIVEEIPEHERYSVK